jgi:uridine kinase
MKSTIREDVLRSVASKIINVKTTHPLRVAVDGVDAAGKTCFSNELSDILVKQGCFVIRASIDDFHNPISIRYKKGRDSPEGYYYDSFNYESLISCLLTPLGPEGSRRYKTIVFDYREDIRVNVDYNTASDDAILLFDGIFLLRPELNPLWDLRIYLDISFEESLRRGMKRDKANTQEISERYKTRYIPGQKLYLKKVNPIKLANVLIQNNDIQKPRII